MLDRINEWCARNALWVALALGVVALVANVVNYIVTGELPERGSAAYPVYFYKY